MSQLVPHVIWLTPFQEGCEEKIDVTLGDLIATLFMYAEFPCPGLLGSSCGLRLGHVQMWFETYLKTMKSPLTCNGVAASTTFARAGKPGMGCWIITLKHRDGMEIFRESPSVVTLVKKFQVDEVKRGVRDTSVTLRIMCTNKHYGIAALAQN